MFLRGSIRNRNVVSIDEEELRGSIRNRNVVSIDEEESKLNLLFALMMHG